MPKWFSPAAILCGLMFVVSPVLIARAPDEAAMGMVYKIYYYHMPSAWMFLLAPLVCGVSSALFLARGRAEDDRRAWSAAELTVLGVDVTVRTDAGAWGFFAIGSESLRIGQPDRKSTRLNSSHRSVSRMPSSA